MFWSTHRLHHIITYPFPSSPGLNIISRKNEKGKVTDANSDVVLALYGPNANRIMNVKEKPAPQTHSMHFKEVQTKTRWRHVESRQILNSTLRNT